MSPQNSMGNYTFGPYSTSHYLNAKACNPNRLKFNSTKRLKLTALHPSARIREPPRVEAQDFVSRVPIYG